MDGEREYKRGVLKKKMDEMRVIEEHLAKQKSMAKEKTKNSMIKEKTRNSMGNQ